MEFAQEVIEECAAFPFGDHDDLVDSMTQAVMRFRQGGLVDHPEDLLCFPPALVPALPGLPGCTRRCTPDIACLRHVHTILGGTETERRAANSS